MCTKIGLSKILYHPLYSGNVWSYLFLLREQKTPNVYITCTRPVRLGTSLPGYINDKTDEH